MNELDLFFQRRSIRKYTGQAVERKTLEGILAAAMSAPSACAKDPWRFIVVQNREKLREIAAVLPNGKFLADAPAGIIVSGDIALAHGNELSFLLQDCSAAIENLLLAATASGLGACWLGVHPREDRIANIRHLFNLPENITPVAVIAIGHPAENPVPRQRGKAEYITWIQ